MPVQLQTQLMTSQALPKCKCNVLRTHRDNGIIDISASYQWVLQICTDDKRSRPIGTCAAPVMTSLYEGSFSSVKRLQYANQEGRCRL